MRQILKLLGLEQVPAGRDRQEVDTVRRIADEIDRLEPDRARYVAAFAYILSRVARADQHVSPEETVTMERIVSDRGGLPDEQAILVVQMAKTQSLLFGGTEDFLVTREFGRLATYEQKLALVDCLFAVSAADGSIRTLEDNEIARTANELKVEHVDYIEVRSRYRAYLEVLRDRPEA